MAVQGNVGRRRADRAGVSRQHRGRCSTLRRESDPPEGVYWYLWMDRLLFRDANWNPHFPDSAAKVAEIFELAQGVKVDGVITSSKKMAHELVALFGDITVPGVEGPLTKELSSEYSEGIRIYQCLPRHISARGKRCFDEDLFFALKDRMTSQYPPDLRRSIIGLLKDQLTRRTSWSTCFHLSRIACCGNKVGTERCRWWTTIFSWWWTAPFPDIPTQRYNGPWNTGWLSTQNGL